MKSCVSDTTSSLASLLIICNLQSIKISSWTIFWFPISIAVYADVTSPLGLLLKRKKVKCSGCEITRYPKEEEPQPAFYLLFHASHATADGTTNQRFKSKAVYTRASATALGKVLDCLFRSIRRNWFTHLRRWLQPRWRSCGFTQQLRVI